MVGCAAIICLLLEKRVSRWMLVLLSVTYFIAMQYLTMRGMFDTLDILLYMLGISLGALLFRLLRLKIK